MPHVAGVDGCRGGWLCVVAAGDCGPMAAVVAASFDALLRQLPADTLMAVDIPIGLAGRGARHCDVAARRRLGPGRGGSVFPAPLRDVLVEATYAGACGRREAIDGVRMSRQAFGLLAKVREVDALMIARPALRSRVRECHPEVSFAEWAGGPLGHGKKSRAGRAERVVLIDSAWPGARARLAAELPRGRWTLGDLHDAFAALWTARRMRDGLAMTLPPAPEHDAHGLVMEIVV